MKRFLAILWYTTLALLTLYGAVALGNYTATQGSGTTFGSIIVSTVHYAQTLICDQTTVVQCAGVDANNNLKVIATGVAQGSTTSGQTGSLVMGAVTTAPPSYTTAQTSPVSLTTGGAARHDSTSWAGTVLGAPSNYGTSPGAVAVPGVNAFVTNFGAVTSGGSTPYTPFVPTASDNHQVAKNGAGTSYSVTVSNNSATKNYLRLYDAGTGFNGCNSATGVIFAMEIPPTDSGFTVLTGGVNGLSFSTGLSLCVTSGFGLTDTTNATATAMYVNVAYK